ncbi:probable RNA-directed DNA polymerase from transposon BS [Trichonephila clavipes]|nr:probable RNA-directed DNA polymerase from transposon BS [Trichonephila clavipes]
MLSFIFRFIANCRGEKRREPVDVQEINRAEITLIRIVQQQEFKRDIKSLNENNRVSAENVIKSLNLFLDQDGVLRVGGRLCPQALLYQVRQRFWPLRGRNVCRKIVHDCLVCFKVIPITCEQIKGNLPKERVKENFPFDCSGIDFIGPFWIKSNKQRKGLDSRTSNGKLWKLLKNISNEQPQAEQCNIILSEDGNLAVNDEQVADLLGLHYKKISRLNFSVEDRSIKIRTSCIVHGCRSDTHRRNSIFSRDFRVNELEAVIGDSCLNKSPGPDGIDHLDLSGRQIFLDIFNCFWNKEQLPRDWRRTTVIPIKKCGKTDGTPESYRRITLTSIACKIMEKMVLRRLTFHLHSHNILPEEQYGFKEGHSTTDQLLYFCQRIRYAHNRKPTNHTVVVFLDLSKAFDRVWNNFLVIKLYKMFGIGGKALPWIYDFLINRLIRVKFNNSLSRSFSFFQGVSQGSVLSQTLFSLYLSGIESIIKRKCEVGAFADDIILWKSDFDLTKLERDINLVLEDIRNFAVDHKLIFNPTKSMVSFSKTNRKLYNFQPNTFLYNQSLTINKHPKYLGFVLDPEILGNTNY